MTMAGSSRTCGHAAFVCPANNVEHATGQVPTERDASKLLLAALTAGACLTPHQRLEPPFREGSVDVARARGRMPDCNLSGFLVFVSGLVVISLPFIGFESMYESRKNR